MDILHANMKQLGMLASRKVKPKKYINTLTKILIYAGISRRDATGELLTVLNRICEESDINTIMRLIRHAIKIYNSSR